MNYQAVADQLNLNGYVTEGTIISSMNIKNFSQKDRTLLEQKGYNGGSLTGYYRESTGIFIMYDMDRFNHTAISVRFP